MEKRLLTLLLVFTSFLAHSQDVLISELTEDTSPAGTSFVPVDDTNDTKKVKLNNLPVSTATQTALNLKASQADLDSLESAVGLKADQSDVDALETDTFGARLPSGVYTYAGNRFEFWFSKDGLVMHQPDNATQTSPGAGAFNGSGVGNKGFVEFWNYENVLLSNLNTLKFTAKSVRDANATPGYVAWNILVNFANGFLTAANDYAILVIDGAPTMFTTYYVLTSSMAEYAVNFSDYSVKAVGGTGVINFTGTTSVGSNVITAVNVPSALTVGMYVRKLPTGAVAPDSNNPFPDGTTITAIDVANSTITVSANATYGGAVTFKQFGGIAPDTRAGTCNGTTTITLGGRTSDAVVTTADLQVNMKVTGTGIPANSYIVSMVANTSITLNAACTTGSPTVAFQATGKTGIPGNAELVGIPMTRLVANNPNTFITNNAPMTPIWAAADGGAPKNVTRMGGVQLIQGSSGLRNHHLNVLKNVTINSDLYEFAK
jgi:hypothetical protein